MGDLRTLSVEGLDLTVNGDGEPRMRDVDLGERLGMSRPRDVRKLIDEHRAELERFGPLTMRDAVARIEKTGAISGIEERTVSEFWLNENQAIDVAVLSRAPKASEVRVMVIRVFTLARRGQLPPPPPDPRLSGSELIDAEAFELIRTTPGIMLAEIVTQLSRRRADVWASLNRLRSAGKVDRYWLGDRSGNHWYVPGTIELPSRARAARSGGPTASGGRNPGDGPRCVLPPPAPRPRRFEVALPYPPSEVLRQVDDYGESINAEIADAFQSVGVIVAELAGLPTPLMPNDVRAHKRMRQHALRILETLTTTSDMARSLVAAVKHRAA